MKRDRSLPVLNQPHPGAKAERHGIEWMNRPGTRGQTWNPVVGCTKVAPGCLNCYAMTMARRIAAAADAAEEKGKSLTEKQRAYQLVIKRDQTDNSPLPHWNNNIVLLESAVAEPFRWREPRTVFPSMTDLFHENVPFEFLDRLFAVMALTPRHTYLLLTKRPERAAEYLDDHGRLMMVAGEACNIDAEASMHIVWPLPNVWLGCSVSDQKTADAAIPHLLRCPAAVRFVSYEPGIGAVDFTRALWTESRDPSPYVDGEAIDWLIIGGESGPGARPFDVAWARSAVKQCREAGVACFVKQLGRVVGETNPSGESVRAWGETLIVKADDGVRYMLRDPKGGDMSEWPEDLRVREWPR